MRRWLRLVPQLACAIACVAFILIAEPILALLAGQRRTRGPDMDNTNDDNPEPTPAEKTLLDAAAVLDNAGAPRTSAELHGFGLNVELNLTGRILWLVEQRNDKELAREREAKEANRWAGEARQLRSDVERASAILAQHGAPMDELMVYAGAEWLGRELAATRERADKVESDLSELHTKLRAAVQAESVAEAFEFITNLQAQVAELTKDRAFLAEQRRQADADLADARRHRAAFMEQRDEALAKVEDLSQRYNRAADELQALTEQRDKATATALSAANDAGQLATENLRLERLVRQLTAKVKRLESAGSGARFALTSESRDAQRRADIVVDAKSGRVLKNRLGATARSTVAARKPKARRRA